jgi:hypothetical protein
MNNKIKPSNLKGYIQGSHQPYTDYNQEIVDWLKINSQLGDYQFNRYIFSGPTDFYTHTYAGSYDTYYTNEQFKEWIGMNKPVAFTKADLKQGYIVECRNNGKYVVVGNLLISLDSERGWNSLVDYKDDLTLDTTGDVIEWDIMKVFSPYSADSRKGLSGCLELLWERVEVDTRKEAIKKELEYAKAKKLRLEAHIEKLEGKIK